MALGFTNTGSVGGYMDGEVVLFSDLGIKTAPLENLKRIDNIYRYGCINNMAIFTVNEAYPNLYTITEEGKIISTDSRQVDLNLKENMFFNDNEILQVIVENTQLFIFSFDEKGKFKEKMPISGIIPDKCEVLECVISANKEMAITMRVASDGSTIPSDHILIVDLKKKYIKAQAKLDAHTIHDEFINGISLETDNEYFYVITNDNIKVYDSTAQLKNVLSFPVTQNYKFVRNLFLRHDIHLLGERTNDVYTVNCNELVHKEHADGFAQISAGYLKSYDNTLTYYNKNFSEIWKTETYDKQRVIGGVVNGTGNMTIISLTNPDIITENIYKLELMTKLPIKQCKEWWER